MQLGYLVFKKYPYIKHSAIEILIKGWPLSYKYLGFSIQYYIKDFQFTLGCRERKKNIFSTND